ncbi:MAG: histidine kinase [Spirochaetes bacterium]|nr:histidine kinase [Spirochaetota bacterium]
MSSLLKNMENKTILKRYQDINAYGFSERLKTRVLRKIEEILSRFKRLDLTDTIYTSVKELIINATKANVKRIVFADHNLDIDNNDDWDKGTAIFRQKLLACKLNEFSNKTKSLNYKVKIRYIYNRNGMRVEVINNTPIPKIDEKRLRGKLESAMKYRSIADFYMDNADNIEGVGMGLALIIILLKNQGLDPDLLRIGSEDEQTVARLEIPFNDHYIPYREIKFREKLEKEKKDLDISYEFK